MQGIVVEKLSKESVLKLLIDFDDSFDPHYSELIEDVPAYAEKLSENAQFVLVKKDTIIIGAVAFYHNVELKMIYIPYVCVSRLHRHKGLATLMIEYLKSHYSLGIERIVLEVRSNNVGAKAMYQKVGFSPIFDNGEKIRMECHL